MSKNTHGGSRPNSGRKPGEPTRLMVFRVNAAKRDLLRKQYGRTLAKLFKQWIETLIHIDETH